MIDKATVKRIIDAADIVEVVSDYVSLTRRGANYVGLCPFHNERTPSFSVSPSRGICHCFSCGKGGSPVNFLMEKEGINYHDALLRLADKYGIKVEERELSDEERAEQSRRESMLTINEWSMRRFIENMNATEEGRNIGLEYFYQRGITKQAIDKFKLGYALDKPTDLYDAAARQGFEIQTLIDVGLCGLSSNGNRPYDRFRGRVIYPMINSAGKVIAFGGRGIKGEPAKYINSPESDIYRKSNELYGIYQARNAMTRSKHCFLVEGYMDVIGMWQSGMENVVASSGTSLTDGQAALIHRFAEKVTVIYDGDSAGIQASLRAIDILLAQKLDVTLLLLPDGDDPDSFSRKHTPEEFRKYVEENEQDFISFQARVLGIDSDNMAARTDTLRTMVKSIALVSDLIQRTVYIQRCSLLTNISEAVLTSEVAKARGDVIDMQRKRRLQARIEAEYPQNSPSTAQPIQTTTTPPANQTVATPIQSNTSSSSLIDKVEKTVMEYVVKYGMTFFCNAVDDEGNVVRQINVAQYVQEEMTLDEMQFRSPFFKRLMELILSMIPDFEQQQSVHMQQVASQIAEEHKAWLQGLLDTGVAMSKIATEEAKQKELEAKRYEEACNNYGAQWIGSELGSTADNEVRRFVLATITPRYQLSKYHSKNMHIESEQERLKDLLPRAINEWKDALMYSRRKELELELKNAVAAGDTPRLTEILREIQTTDAIRSEVAKTLGERIIEPRR